LHGFFARSFTAVRASRQGWAPKGASRNLIVYTNHPSWWDPIHFFLLASIEMPDRRLYGPMDAAALEKYGFFRKLGVFGVERSRRGAARFLLTSQAILALPGASLWMTAQGEFSDPRRRPVRLRPGLAHLIRRLDEATVVPLAVEYPFWNEKRPEALSRFGRPLQVSDGASRSVEEWTERLEERLTETMDALAEESRARDPRLFRTLVRGRVGVGAVYDLGRRLAALVRGRPFHPAHGSEEP
jgi:1-acyl-sn-glycerol-3-phosphate acyltransferase